MLGNAGYFGNYNSEARIYKVGDGGGLLLVSGADGMGGARVGRFGGVMHGRVGYGVH